MKFRHLEKYRTGGAGDKFELSIPLPQSPSGKYYRWCPVPECQPNLFLLGHTSDAREISEGREAGIRRVPGTTGTTCPYCGHDDQDDEFTYRDDIEAVRRHFEWMVQQDIHEELNNIARDFNRKSARNRGLISLKMDVKPSRKSKPLSWREDLLRNLECNICGRECGVYAIALFCPDCGGRNLSNHFRKEIELVTQQVTVASKAEAEYGRELSYRLLGNAHEDVLTAFEAYLKTAFKYLARRVLPQEDFERLTVKKSIGNSFQNIEKGRKLFEKLGIDPYKELSTSDLDFLGLNIQKRHVIGHNLSLIDEFYAEVAEGEQPGQTVQLLGEEILRFADICGTVISCLEQDEHFGGEDTHVKVEDEQDPESN